MYIIPPNTHTHAYTNIYVLEDTQTDISAVKAHSVNAIAHYEVLVEVSFVTKQGHKHCKTAPPSTSSLLGGG